MRESRGSENKAQVEVEGALPDVGLDPPVVGLLFVRDVDRSGYRSTRRKCAPDRRPQHLRDVIDDACVQRLGKDDGYIAVFGAFGTQAYQVMVLCVSDPAQYIRQLSPGDDRVVPGKSKPAPLSG